MTATSQIFDRAQIAEASYSLLDRIDFTDSNQVRRALDVVNKDTFNGAFSAAQATEFVKNWRVVNHIPDTATGFSATLFERLEDGNGSGEFNLAIRGSTQGVKDFIEADAEDIFLDGVAINQVVDLYNFWQRLRVSTSGTYTAARLVTLGAETRQLLALGVSGGEAAAAFEAQLLSRGDVVIDRGYPTTVRRIEFVSSSMLSDPLLRNGAGFQAAISSLNVSGHSLGGHLAMAFTRLFPTADASALGINGLGFRPDSINVRNLFATLGGASDFDPSSILNLYGVAGFEFAAQNTALLRQVGDYEGIYIETAGLGSALGHSAAQMTDSAAVYDLFLKLDATLAGFAPTQALSVLKPLLEAASAQAGSTFERMVDSFVKLFRLNFTSLDGALIGDREALYQRIVALQGAIKGMTGLRLASLVDTPVDGLKNLAINGDIDAKAYRYALKELNPFAVFEPDSLYAQHNANGELDLYDPATDKGSMTDEWLQARAQALAARAAFNTADSLLTQQPEFAVDDKLTGFGTIDRAAGAKRLVFGTENPDTLSGAFENDKLFGGAGGDTISGGPGDDYIEGNDGFDTIDAGFGDDELYGGKGNDTISGFTGVDKLYGGAGEDTIDGGVGNDVIYGDKKDAPDSTEITGDDTIDGGWGDDQIWGGGGVDTIHGGRGDDKIEGNARDDTLYGDDGVDTVKGDAGIDTIYGGAGRDTIDGGDDGDIIYGGDDAADGSTFGNTLSGDAGDDQLYGDGGVDTIDGGAGKDLLVGNFGKDTLTGGSEDDELYGDTKEENAPFGDDDQIDGGAGNDKLEGGGGRDVLLGGAGEDRLRGGKGVGDYMVGGAGDDTYFYRVDDGVDLIYDEGGEGRIIYEGQQLNGGANRTKGALTWYDGDPCDADFTYSASGDPDAGPVTLRITSKAGGQLTVFDFDNGELGINLSEGNDPNCGKRPPTPARRGPAQRGDPLVLDMGAAGIATFGLSSDLYFDMDGDGFAESTGWAGREEGVLVYDKNLDGILNDGQELFGDFTRLAGGQLATGGFQALSAYDANHDGTIDAQDPVWSSLRVGVWETDPFGGLILGDPKDAMSLKGLEALGITAISVASSIVPGAVIDPGINVQTRTGTYTLEGGAGSTTREVAEFRFARDEAHTKFLRSLPVPEENASDPSLALGGLVMNLQQALIRDGEGGYLGKPVGTLRAKFDALLNEADPTQWFARFEELLFAWTGADAIPAGAKTGPFDARHAAVLEKAYGQSFQNPNYDQWAGWQTAYEQLAETLYSSLLAETHLENYYDAIDWAQNDVTQALFGDLSAVQSILDDELASNPARGRALAIEFGRSLRGLGHTQDTGYYALREHFIAQGADPALGFAFDAAGKAAPYKPGTEVGFGTIFTSLSEAAHFTSPTSPYGLTGDDIFYAEGPAGSSSHLVGTTGTNVLVAGAGDDLLWAHEGDDLLDGGAGNDTLKGLAGNDVYIFRRGSGRDTIQELDGIDTVFFGSRLRREDLVLRRTPDGGFEIRIAGTDDVLVIPAPQSWVPSPHGGSTGQAEQATSTIDRLMFDDGSLMRLQDLVNPTGGDDDFAPLDDPFDDVFDMLGGNDRVNGKRGNDTLYGGAGNDTLIGGEGNDILEGGTGDDTLFATTNDPYFAGFYRWGSYLGVGAGNGSDEYRFGFGDGHDTLTDLDTIAGNVDTIALGAGATPEDVTLFAEGNDMVVQLSTGDTLTVKAQYLEAGGVSIERITFADGTVWSGDRLSTVTRIGTPDDDVLQGVLRRRNHLTGGAGDDALSGGLEADVLEGGEGKDTLYGGDGADIFDGGAGDDLLQEPASSTVRSVGADVFLFGRGDGNDRLVSRKFFAWRASIPPVVDDDVVRFKAGISPDDLTVTGSNSFDNYSTTSTDIVVRVAGDADSSLRIEGFLEGRQFGSSYSSTVRRFEFADGTVWNYDQILDRLQWIGTSDADTLTGGSGSEHVFGLEGDDRLNGRGGTDVVEGGEGNDILYGENGDDTLLGGDGDDRLEPGAGNDTVDGGVGNDLIGLIGAGPMFDAPHLYNLGGWATLGDLTVLFGRGDGQDTIQVANARADSNDTLRLRPGIAPDDIALVRVRDDLVLDITGTEDRVTVRDWFLSRDLAGGTANPFRIENIVFDDGTTLDAEAIRARILVGGEGNDALQGYDDHDDLVLGNGGDDRLSGSDGEDSLAGGEGNDLLEGGGGADVYGFARGDGNDTVLAFGGEDAIGFDAGIAPDDVLVRNRGGNMVLTLDTGEGMVVAGQFVSPGDVTPIAEVRFDDGSIWGAQTLRELALEGTDGDDFIEGFDWGDDAIAGGAGDDELEGGYGDDLYLYGRGDGDDYITDRGGFDAISFGELLPSEVEFFLEGRDLFVYVPDTDEDVGIGSFFDGSDLNDTIEQFLFDDGNIVLSGAEVLALTGSDSEDQIFGTPDDDELHGGDQRTLILAGEGNDLVFGGGGDDELRGGGGADELYGGEGVDDLLGEDGDDLLAGGEGDDFVEGGAGNDTIVLGLGDGLDDILAGEVSGGNFTPREGFEQAYDEALQELSDLDDYAPEDIFWTHIWSSESDGGWASNIAPDLLDRLINLGSNSVTAAEARLTLEDLEFWLTTPRRADSEGTDYEWLEYEARDELAELLQQDGGYYANNFWTNLEWQQEIPNNVFYPLLDLYDEGLPEREAEIALNGLLGWLYVSPFYEDDLGGEINPPHIYGGAAVALSEAQALADEEIYTSNFWGSWGWAVMPVPSDLEDALLALDAGVPRDEAIDTLEALRDFFLGRESAGEVDTIEFGPGIAPDDLEVAVTEDGEDVVQLAIGVHGTDDGVIISENGLDEFNTTSVSDLSAQRFRIDDGTELTLQDLLDRADGRIGEQTGTSGDDDLRGSAAPDVIFARRGDDIVMARGGDDEVHGQAGDDVISAGAGDDQADGGPGDDIIAGERGDDAMRGGPGNDTFVFNYGDGHDYIDAYTGDDDDVDMISFGADIAPEMVSATVDADGMLRLWVQGGEGGSIRMPWFNMEEGISPIDPPAVRRVQFVDANGAVRVFDLATLLDDSGSETTGTVTPAGGGRAVSYAQNGDLFGVPYYASGNASTDADDVVIGTDAGDDIETGDGGDVVAAGAGDDYVDGGDGNDSIDGGAGDDFLVGGKGDDTLAGGDGDDSYWFEPGDGTLTINDDAFDRGPNRLEFGDGIALEDVELAYDAGYLVITTSAEGDEIRLSNFNFEEVYDNRAVGNYEFGDGSTLTYDDLIARGFHLSGTPGVDLIPGTEVGDVVEGFDGDDVLEGRWGDDTLYGGAGSDTYVFSLFDGEDTIVDRETDVDRNALQFNDGIDPSSIYVVLDGGDLYLYYGDVDDYIRVADVQPDDALQGLPFDLMTFADGSTLSLADIFANGLEIYGTPDADILNGTQGGDLIHGFEGVDLLSGGAGDDIYYLTESGGFDTIVDTVEGGQFNTVVIDHTSAEIQDDLVASFDRGAGTLTLRVRGTDDGVVLSGFDADNPFANRALEMFELPQGGVSFSYDELIAGGFELEGTAGADVLLGSVVHDTVRGLDGNDVIATGTGNDVAEGGAGNDLYFFARGDGVLTIRDDISRNAENILAFGPGITLADLRNNLRFESPDPLTENPGVLRIGLGNGDEVRIEGFDPDEPETGAHAVETYRFDDGTSISYRDLVLNTFIVQGDTGDDLLFGTAIQDRLYGFEGDDELRAGGGNDALTGGTGDDLLAGGDGADMYVFHRGDGHDVIADSGDNFDGNFLSFDAEIDPAGLVFTQDGGDMVISYTENDSVRIRNWNPDLPAIRELRFGDTTTTVAGLQNLQPYAVGGLANQSVLEDAAFSYQLPADVFADPEAGVLSYYASLADGGNAGYALPNWLAFDPATRTFYGTPENPDVGGIDILVTAADEFGADATQALHLSVMNTNDAPALVAPVADAESTEDLPFSLTLPAGTFADIDAGDIVSLGVSLANGDPLPAWLGFDAATRTLSGAPGNDDVGTVELRVTATDLDGASASDLFLLAVANANDGPVVSTALADQAAIEDELFSFTVPAGTLSDVDLGDAQFTFASLANGDPLPAWLSYNPDTQTFAGTPLNEDVGAFSVAVTAVDSNGASASDTFDLSVANTNDAPEIGFAELDTLVVEDNSLPADAVHATGGSILFADVDPGDAHEVQVGTLESGYLGEFTAQIVADSTDGGAGSAQWSFSVDNGALDSLGEGETRAQSYEVLVDDGHGGVDARTVTVTLAGVNDAPLLAAPIADQNAAAGTAFSFSFAAGTFTDIDAGDTLSYTASLSDGSALPSWLSFDGATRTFRGTAPADTTPQSMNILVAASDTANASATDLFVLNLAGNSGGSGIVPIVGTNHDDVIAGTAGNDVIDGRKGYDKMSGGAGDDVYYVDRTGSKVDLVTEGAVAGYDTVYSSASYTLGSNVEELHLVGGDDLDGKGNSLANMLIGNAGDNKLYGEVGNDLLLDDEGDDRLDGGAGDDVLDGGAGDDTLLGGAGNDLFVHTAGGGHDVVQDSGGMDAIRFSTGIAAEDLTVRRSDNDLVMRLSGGNGSVTVKDWFSSSNKRVEQMQFADGTVWDESAIRARVTSGGYGHGGHGGSQGDHNGYCDDRLRAQGNGHDGDDDGYDGHHGGRHDHKDHHGGTGDDCGTDEMRDAIAQRLKRSPNYDFTALAQYLQRNGGGGYGAMTPQQIAQRWLQVQNCVGSLAQVDDDCGGGHGGHGGHGGGYGRDEDGHGHGGWGHSGSTGQNRGCGGMDTFSGLGEGFRRL